MQPRLLAVSVSPVVIVSVLGKWSFAASAVAKAPNNPARGKESRRVPTSPIKTHHLSILLSVSCEATPCLRKVSWGWLTAA